MGDISQTIEASRAAYREHRYPGDLAAEVIGSAFGWRRVPPVFLLWGTLGAGAVAAAAALLVMVSRPAATPATAAPAPGLPLVRDFRVFPPKLDLNLPDLPEWRGLPSLPEHWSVAPPLRRVVPEGVRDLISGEGVGARRVPFPHPQLPA